MIIQVLAGWLQIYRGTKYSRFPRFVIIIVVYHHYFVYQSLHGHLVFHHLLINIEIPELSFLLLQVSGLLASYEKTTCKCVMEVITYWPHKHKNTQRLDKLLIEKSCSFSPTIMVTWFTCQHLDQVSQSARQCNVNHFH